MARPRPILIGRPAARGGRQEPARLLNLGPKSSMWLAAAGIRTRAQLAALGPIGACRRLRECGQPATVLLAYAIEGALTGQHWNDLPPATKAWLRAEFAQLKRPAPARGRP